MNASYTCQCGHVGSDAFISLFKEEQFCSNCGQKLASSPNSKPSKKGRPKTVNNKIIRSIRFDDDEWQLIREAAAKNGQDISKFIRGHLRTIATAILRQPDQS